MWECVASHAHMCEVHVKGCEGGTHKLHGAVVDKEVLDFGAPVGSEFEVSVAE